MEMEVKFKVTGEARKALVKAAGQALGWEPVYKGAPSFAYVVSNIIISRDGTLSWDERTDEAAILHLLGKLREMGFVPAEEEIDPDTLTIEMPLAGFSEAALENLDRLIAGKAALIKKAIGADALPVERSETTLRFPWFSFNATGDEVTAYSRFIGALCAAAKGQKRVTGRGKAVENEKYAFRVFLLRLGFVGDDYKEARRILLKNLSGNSAFKSGASAKTEMDADA
jgi:hypothetical protein